MAVPVLETTPDITPETLGLWPPQLEAVGRMRDYIHAYQNEKVDKAALVHMPTGSGKTGVIAALARCIPEVGCVLILTPRLGLRRQLVREVRSGFFECLSPAVDPATLPKNVIEIDEIKDMQALEGIDSTIIVATIQMISGMHKHHPEEWGGLLRHVSLVIVDEGHCEPAPSWSLAIRSFKVPKIIFTATPFRNDLKIFEIDPAYIFSYTYHEALRDHILREAEFMPMPETRNPNEFMDGVLGFFDEQCARTKGEKPRLIIRCDGREQIRQIGTVLEMRGRDYLAIHETFADDGENPHERRHVPNPKTEKATIWVHQYKLQEGIDDPRFRVLAIYNRVQNGRDLVQQVGRILRNPGGEPDAKGYILDHSGGQHWELWSSFLKYDTALTTYGIDAFNLQTGSAWLQGLFDSQPVLTYMKYRFRTPVNIEELDLREDLVLPRMINLRNKQEGFKLENLCEQLEMAFKEEDRSFQRYEEGGAILYVYVSFENSPLLARHYFLEPRLGVTYLREIGKYLAYYDSSGHLPVDLYQTRLGKAASPEELKKLFSDSVRTRLTQVSLRNSNLGTIAIRSRTVSAADMLETVSAFDDHMQICANVTGYSQEDTGRHRRYLGFERGRVAESSGRCLLDEYESWLTQVVGAIGQPRKTHLTFRRYALLANKPKNTRARHILLDLSEVEDCFETVGRGKTPAEQPMKIKDVSCAVTDGSFTLEANETPLKVSIKFDEANDLYLLESSRLDGFYQPKPGETDRRGLISYLNEEQSFRVIPASGNLIYTLGEFYRPPFPVGADFDRELCEVSKVLRPVPLLGQIKTEKGILLDPAGWGEDTLFGIIAQLGKPAGPQLQDEFGDPDILVCDDMGTESADFILADTRRRRVVFIHAKATPKQHPASASALQEVIGQATKNINFLGMFNEQVPVNLNRWDDPWKNKDAKCTTPRIRLGKGEGRDVWEKIRTIIRHPLAEREVWLFMGQMLSKGKFESLLGKDPVGAEALQAAYLLYATMANVASVGAKLRVFCYP